jgi:hypothetical protein
MHEVLSMPAPSSLLDVCVWGEGECVGVTVCEGSTYVRMYVHIF